MPESPFRFVVLDDPVQAMDPAKVDGLVKVLLDIAKTRQVIVFSHDDRFASAVRPAPKHVPIKVLEVFREANFARELSKGSTHELVEKAWEDARKTRDRLALAIDDPTRIDAWLEKATYRKRALRKANSIHVKLQHGDPMDACRDVEKTIADLRNGAR